MYIVQNIPNINAESKKKLLNTHFYFVNCIQTINDKDFLLLNQKAVMPFLIKKTESNGTRL